MHETENIWDDYLGSGNYLKRAIKKYGYRNFQKEILHCFDNEDDMKKKEAELVTEDFCDRKDTYNICPGGKGGFGYINKNNLNHSENWYKSKRSESSREKIRQYRINILKDPDILNTFILMSKKGREKCKILYPKSAFFQKQHSDETKKHLKKVHKGKHIGKLNSQYGSFWITNGVDNKKCRDIIPKGWYKGRI
jgi:hypothetical protein